MKRKLQVALIVTSIIGFAIWLANAQGYNAFLNPTYQASGGPQTSSLQENSVIGFHKLSWVVTGTVSTCQVTVDTSPDNSAWSTGGAITVQTCTSTGNSGSATSATANFIRINASTLSGTGSITFTYTGYVQNPSGGGGLPAGLTFVSPTFTISSAGNGNAVLALSGNTSGTATFTAPAVAGTSTNPVTASNVLTLPAGAQATTALQIGTNAGTGFWNSNNAAINMSAGGVFVAQIGGSGVNASFVQPICDFAVGTGCLTFASGLINTSGAGNPLVYQTNNSCAVTADITLSTSATNICSFTLPAIAHKWAWQCDLLWAVTAGTTPTLSIGANPSQTPTGTTNGAANILTSNADVGVDGSAAISASGTTNLVTTGALTPAATVFQAYSFGTLLASGTAGTFAINMTGTGASFAGAAKAGSSCYLF